MTFGCRQQLEAQLAFHQVQGAYISFTDYRRISADNRVRA